MWAAGGHAQPGEPALSGAVRAEAKDSIDAREARGIGQYLRRKALGALGLDQRGDERDGIIGKRGRAHRILAEFRTVAAGEIAVTRGVGGREPGALERGGGEDLRVVREPGADELNALAIEPRGGEPRH